MPTKKRKSTYRIKGDNEALVKKAEEYKKRGHKLPGGLKTQLELHNNPPTAPSIDVIEGMFSKNSQCKIKSKEELQDRIENYFKERIQPEYNDNGEIERYRWTERISVSGLALSLGITRETFLTYRMRPDYRETILQAVGVIEHFNEQGVLESKQTPIGLFFILKNGFGWKDAQEQVVTHTNLLGDKLGADDIRERLLNNTTKYIDSDEDE